MFKRILVEDWAVYVPMVSFAIFATVFIWVTLRALRIRETERAYMASLPLDIKEEESQPEIKL